MVKTNELRGIIVSNELTGQFAAELCLAAVHRDTSHDGYCPVLFHYLTFEVVDN